MPLMRLFFAPLLLAATLAEAQDAAVDNVVLVTIDGLRWQEVFRGLDEALARHEEYNPLGDALGERFGGATAAARAARLFPFLHDTMFRAGAVYGDRDSGSCAQVTNPWHFSWPGYNEILSGMADRAIASNDPVPNPNVTLLEWLNCWSRPGSQGRFRPGLMHILVSDR